MMLLAPVEHDFFLALVQGRVLSGSDAVVKAFVRKALGCRLNLVVTSLKPSSPQAQPSP